MGIKSVEKWPYDGSRNVEYTGIEDSLDAWGTIFLVLGIVAGVICILAAGTVTKQYDFDSWGHRGIAWYLVGVGIGAALEGMFARALLQAGAEIIRLLRTIARQRGDETSSAG